MAGADSHLLPSRPSFHPSTNKKAKLFGLALSIPLQIGNLQQFFSCRVLPSFIR
jgi:hypothetical protein